MSKVLEHICHRCKGLIRLGEHFDSVSTKGGWPQVALSVRYYHLPGQCLSKTSILAQRR